MDRHVRTLSFLFIAGGIAGAPLGIILLFKLGPVTNFLLAFVSRKLAMSVPFAVMYVTAVSWMLLLLAVPAIVSGFGLRKYNEWARVIALVVALACVIIFPLGTILGAYGVWVLLSPESEYLFLEPPSRR
jgi:hypothetical protein